MDEPPPPLLSKGAVARAISHEHERAIVAATVRRALSVREISEAAGLPLPTTYRHVALLAEAGLLVVERSAISEEGKRFEMYRSRLRFARIEVDENGQRVVWELNAPVEERIAQMWRSFRRGD